MSEIDIVLDGITVQHAGELLFDTNVTSSQRSVCKETYIRCLEDFAFALVYGSKFGVTDSLPHVGAESPGTLLTKEFCDHFAPISPHRGVRPENLVHSPEVQQRLSCDLRVLDLAYERGRHFWEHWVLRDITSYLGTHETLFQSLENPSGYIFAKKPDYIIDRELQELIPPAFVEQLTDCVQRSQLAHNVQRAAIAEFVSRSALTHLTIFWWYEVAIGQSTLEESFRIPHITRSVLRLVQQDSLMQKQLSDSLKLLSRHALSDAVSSSLNREEVVDRLHSLPGVKPYADLRSYFQELLHAATTERDEGRRRQAIEALQRDIQTLLSKEDVTLDPLEVQAELSVPGIAGLKVRGTSSNFSAFGSLFSKSRRVLRTRLKYDIKQYTLDLNRVFPELQLPLA